MPPHEDATPTIMRIEPHYHTGILLYLSDGAVVEVVPVNVDGPVDPGIRDKVLLALRSSLHA